MNKINALVLLILGIINIVLFFVAPTITILHPLTFGWMIGTSVGILYYEN